MIKITKTVLADILTSTEHSVITEEISAGYWRRKYMGMTKATLEDLVIRLANRITAQNATGYRHVTDAQVDRLVEIALSI